MSTGSLPRIGLVPTSVSPVEAKDALAPKNRLMKVPSLVTDDGQTLFDGWRRRHPKLADWYRDFAELPGIKATQPPPS